MPVSIEPTANRTALNVELGQTFLLEDAMQIGAALADVAPGTPVEIDFKQVRELHGAALARLVDVVRAGRARVWLRGMSAQQWKLLGYLGVPLGLLQRPAEG
jgi:hypothetical protein